MITASGGPFRGLSAADLAAVTPEQALAHPTWSMGAKITIDSATLMNKGLEVIEAHFLFGVPYERIEVAVHPQSIVHAMVRFRDGALLAHLGLPDMRVPISYALTYPERAETPAPRLDLASLTLEFEPPDTGVFRCLALARAAGEAGGTAPCVLNAANEVAVAAFLAGGCAFPGIADVVERVLGQMRGRPLESVEQVLEADRPRPAAGGRRGGGGGMSYFVAIAGLLMLVLVHELGHFLAAKAVGMRGDPLLDRLPAADRTQARSATPSTRLGAIPLGGYVKIPGMNRPEAGDLWEVGDLLERAESLPERDRAGDRHRLRRDQPRPRAGRIDAAAGHVAGAASGWSPRPTRT